MMAGVTQWQPPTESWHPRPVDPWQPAPVAEAGPGFAPKPPPFTPQLTVRAGISWLVIILCTFALAIIQFISMSGMRDQATESTGPSIEAVRMGRHAVGSDQLYPGQGGALLAGFDKSLEDSPHPIEAQIRSVMLAGEIGSDRDIEYRLNLLLSDRPAWVGDNTIDAELIERIYSEGYLPTESESKGLVERHAWFGELAATHNLPADDDDRESLRRSSKRFVIGMSGFMIAVILAGLLGLVLFVVMIVLFCLKKQRLRGPSGQAAHPTAYLEVVALFLVFFIGLQVTAVVVMVLFEIDLLFLALILSPLPILWPLLMRVPWKQFKTDMGFHTGNGLLRELFAGLVGYLAGLPVIAVGMGLTILLGMLSGGSADHPIESEVMGGGLFTVILLISSAVIWAPLVEESIFRAAFYRHIRQFTGVPGWLLATVISSFVFAAIHPQGYVGLPALMSIAFVLAGLREWRGSIIPSMFAHALHNGALMVMLGIMLWA